MALENNDVFVRYILGDLSEAERERVEEEYFVNNETWQKLGAVESDLIDSYVRGELLLDQREQFEKYFLASPKKRERVEFARALLNPAAREAAAEEPGGSWKSLGSMWAAWRPAIRITVTVGGMALVIAAGVLTIYDLRLRGELSAMRSNETELRYKIQTLQQQVASAQQINGGSGTETTDLFSSETPTVSMLLTPGLLRNGENGSQSHILPIPSVPSAVVLLLSLETDDYPQYDVLLRTAEGKEIRHLEGLVSQPIHGGRVVAVHLPTQLFPRGDYVATLAGKSAQGKLQIVESYSFSVDR